MREDVVGGGEIVGDEVMDEGPIAENLEGLSESEAGRVESHHLAMPLLLLHPHCFENPRLWIELGFFRRAREK